MFSSMDELSVVSMVVEDTSTTLSTPFVSKIETEMTLAELYLEL